MNMIGTISAVDGRKAKVSFIDLNLMSPFIKMASHVTTEVGDIVVVAILNDNEIRNGIIIGVVE